MTVIGRAALLVADAFDMHGDFSSGWWIVMMVGVLLFWGLIVVGVIWVVRELARGRAKDAALESPTALLDRRFASGEISAEEYRERKAILAEERREGERGG